MKKVLIYAYGNPGRQDDAAANELVKLMEHWIAEQQLLHVDCDSNYQLNIEDAELISHYDIVYFVDASMESDLKDVKISEVNPSDAKVEFSMHAVSPAYVLDLCQKLYHKKPETFLVHIKGYAWDFMEPMTEQAHANLQKAFSLLKYKVLMLENRPV
jgi:hydrogenase maturation protease